MLILATGSLEKCQRALITFLYIAYCSFLKHLMASSLGTVISYSLKIKLYLFARDIRRPVLGNLFCGIGIGHCYWFYYEWKHVVCNVRWQLGINAICSSAWWIGLPCLTGRFTIYRAVFVRSGSSDGGIES